ncbi:P-loop NTPase fold protein [Leifsonia kafniensis]|uniref:P-loop NTPase fold protein n=1 Tax=Leifsonia kafniensis TaxID=475957 RepID=A0ABP7KAR5_9MICO
MKSDASSATPAAWDLLPLTPKYLEAEHGPYVAAIISALQTPEVRNIALSGNYGVGKSSILQRVTQLESGRIVELSLSTLAPIEISSLDDSVPAQATTPTNRIQQEIVKQLLYREEPNRAPGSRFRRIERFQWTRELVLAGIIGFAVAVLFLLAGWGATVTTTLQPVVDFALWIYPILFALATGAVYALRFLLHGRVHIKAFSAGPAAVTLDEKSVSYFDQYLDEIVYFFETSDYDVVIFEDIDRFNDSHIFETLRSLNTLLNAAPEVSRTNRTIRFVYAIKDSIFDRIGLESEGRKDATLADITDPAEAEAVRANRTKFFDLVIPVVPFITHRSARNLASQLLGGLKNDVSPDLIDLAGRFVPDMRLLKNVRNEFIVFRDRIFSGDGQELDLSETDLFAMMLYKSTHLSDFEAIRLGKSKLDKLYAAHRKLVSTNIRRIEGDVRATRSALTRAGNTKSRSERLGDALVAHIGRTARAAGCHEQGQQYRLGNMVKTVADLQSPEFWQEFTTAPSATLNWRNSSNNTLSFVRSDLAEALSDPLDSEAWEAADKEGLNETLADQLEQLKFLRSADIGAAMKRPEFLVDFEDVAQSLDSVAELFLTRGLGFQLVREGHINRNFTLYTSTFHGNRVSSAATNFIIHHVEQNLMDVDFELSGADVDAVVRERGAAALSEHALYNIAILDHLLRTDVDKADVMVTSIARLGDDARRFLQAYLNAGTERSLFLARLVHKSARVLPYLVSQAELDDATRLQLVSDALANLARGVKYFTDDATTRYLAENYTVLPALTVDRITAQTAVSITIVFGMAGIKPAELGVLSDTARKAFVARNLYTITRPNLLAALGEEADLALDTIRSIDEDVYGYLLTDIAGYLVAVDGHAATNVGADGFISVIEDVLEHGPNHLDDVVARASDKSRVSNLSDTPEAAWPALARSNRFPATFNNIMSYVETVGLIDEDLANVLNEAGTIGEVTGAVETEKVQLALKILSSRAHINAATRVALVESLRLQDPIEAASVEPENGSLFAQLIRNGVVVDDAETYAHFAPSTNWDTHEQAIQVSTKFKGYMTPELIGDDLSQLLVSTKVGKPVKLAVLDEAIDYADAGDAAGRRELARFALANRGGLPVEVIEQLAADRVDAGTVTSLLRPHLGALDDPRLFALLRTVGGAYAQLTFVGYDKPKISNTEANRKLLAELQSRGIVSTFDEHETRITVNKKYK